MSSSPGSPLSPLTSPSRPRPPAVVSRAETTVGSYRLERRLGAGGMGEVWLGRHRVSNGVSAVKLLHPRLAERTDAASLFAREKSALLRLAHPHIVPVFEVGKEHIAMAYVEGASLARRLRAGIEPALAFRAARQIASALAHAHTRGVLHLDVKPSNTLLDAAGNAYLADFGAALLLDDANADAPTAGTPAYVAPERAYGQAFGPAADQFALGRTLLAALLGTEKLPPWGDDASALPASIPPHARALIARAIAIDPTERFPSMEAMEAALAACDLEGLAPHVAVLSESRATSELEWADAPRVAEVVAPEIARADYTLDALERAGRVDAAKLATFRRATGIASTGLSLYAHARSLGEMPSASWPARALSIIVLIPGYAMARECWADVAIALVRDNPDSLVVTADAAGFGDCRYAEDPPSLDHLGYEAVARAVLALLDLLALTPVPTVLLGHSLGGTGLLLLTDDAVGPNRARVVLTPMFSDVLGDRQRRMPSAPMLRVLAVLFAIRLLYRLYFIVRFTLNAGTRLLTPARRRAMIDEACRLPPRTHLRLAAAVARPLRRPAGPFRRTFFVLGLNDPEASPELCARAKSTLGVRSDRMRWLASGCHYAHIETSADPEGTQRNRDEIVRLVDEALDEILPSRRTSTELAETVPDSPEASYVNAP